MTYDKPSIVVICNDCLDSDLEELLAGIEEEGVPYKVYKNSFQNVNDECIRAVNMSSLDMGIVITLKNIFILSRDMINQDYLFKSLNYNKENLRLMGSHAGRFVKGIQFKNIDR
jgi:hypothetical protein